MIRVRLLLQRIFALSNPNKVLAEIKNYKPQRFYRGKAQTEKHVRIKKQSSIDW